MNADEVLARLGIGDQMPIAAGDWAEAQKSRPPEAIPFLLADYVRRACALTFLPDEWTELTVALARKVAGDESLAAFTWYCHDRLFRVQPPKFSAKRLPLLTTALGREAGLWNVLLLLSGVPAMQQAHRQRGIPEAVARDTIADLKLCIETEDYTKENQYPGIHVNILGWLLLHWRGELYRLGRLQFVPDRFGGKIRVYRHAREGAVIALAEPGVAFDREGYIADADDKGAFAPAWTSALTVTPREIAGHPVDPRGHALRQLVHLPATEWKNALAPGDNALGMHIPTGAPMTYEACGDSYRQACDFFPRYFPEKKWAALTCSSWLLDPLFERLMPPSSNLVRFQKEMYLFPVPPAGKRVLKTIFGVIPEDLSRAPRNTSMQRAVAEHLEHGGRLRGGGCFLFPQDLNWGSEYYRKQKLPF